MTSLKAKTRLQAMLLSLRAIDIEVSYFGKIQFRTFLLTALNIGTSICVCEQKTSLENIGNALGLVTGFSRHFSVVCILVVRGSDFALDHTLI